MDNGFSVLDLSADKAYSSKANLKYVDELGAAPYIPFRQEQAEKCAEKNIFGEKCGYTSNTIKKNSSNITVPEAT